MKKKRVVFGVFYALIAIFIGFLIFKTYSGYKQNLIGLSESLPIRTTLSKKDTLIISPTLLGRAAVHQIRDSKVRNSIYEFRLDKKYPLFVYEIPITDSFHLDKITFEKISVDRTVRVSYGIIDNLPLFQFQFNAGGVQKIDNVYLTFSDDGITKKLYGDSAVSFFGFAKNFSIRYGNKEPIDLYFTVGERKILAGKKLSVFLYFIKHQNSLKMYLLTSDDTEKAIPTELRQLLLPIQRNIFYPQNMGS